MADNYTVKDAAGATITIAATDNAGVYENKAHVISATLPTGAATEATLAALLTESIFTGRMGEVSASPTANTVLERLKALKDTLDGIISGSEAQVDVVTSALPTGAATETTLDAIKTAIEKVDDLVETGAATVTEGIVTAGAVGTPVVLGAALNFRSVTLIGIKAARTNNAGVIYYGTTSGNDTQMLPLNPGQIVTVTAPPGKHFDRAGWYIDVTTANDGVGYVMSN